jgi:tetratricopeptide (TPR) repeat protein
LRLLRLVLLFALCVAAHAQVRATRMVMVMRFENRSKAPGLEWVGESFPEVVGQTLGKTRLFVVSRPERLYAFDRLGIPASVQPSRATLLRIAEEMDVDYVVSGTYDYDGRNLTARAQVLDVKRLRISREAAESAAITRLIEIESALAAQVSREIQTLGGPPSVPPAAITLRLDALENYIKGITTTDVVQRLKYLKEAVRLAPNHVPSVLALGKAYFDKRDYEQASTWLARVPKTDEEASEANFFLGLCAFYQGSFAAAEDAFRFTAQRLPLIEVFNNLGVVMARRGKREALEYFQRAIRADVRDPEYRFNLAVSLYRSGDTARAARELKEVVAMRPQDTEARSLLQMASSGGGSNALPLERIRRTYDESSYRQLALEIQNVKEMRYAGMPPAAHAAAHVTRGNELLMQAVPDQSETEFREAIVLDPTNALAHAGLAEILEARGETAAARNEANAANHIAPSVQACLVLARIEMKQQRNDAAVAAIDQALKIEPTNSHALELRRQLSGK